MKFMQKVKKNAKQFMSAFGEEAEILVDESAKMLKNMQK